MLVAGLPSEGHLRENLLKPRSGDSIADYPVTGSVLDCAHVKTSCIPRSTR